VGGEQRRLVLVMQREGCAHQDVVVVGVTMNDALTALFQHRHHHSIMIGEVLI
jgi:hypothetical protein